VNVLFLALDILLDTPRGDAIHVRELARSLAERGNHIDLVTATPPGLARFLGDGVDHHTRPNGSDLAVVRFCAKLAERAAVDVVYERRLSPKVAFGTSLLARVPFVVEVNGVEEEAELQGRISRTPLRPLKARIRRRMYGRAESVVTVSSRLAQVVRARGDLSPDKIFVVPNGVNLGRFVPKDRYAVRTTIGIPPAHWIVYVGNLVRWQGVENLIRAMPLIASSDSLVRLLIVGDGPLRQKLADLARRTKVEAKVSFVGSIPHESVPDYIGSADVCVAPFARERNEAIGLSPLKVYEYMACGRPIVASRVSGISELFEASEAGLLVPPDDPPSLASAILRILESPADAHEMGVRGRLYAERQCSWAKTAEQVEHVLQGAIQNHRGAHR